MGGMLATFAPVPSFNTPASWGVTPMPSNGNADSIFIKGWYFPTNEAATEEFPISSEWGIIPNDRNIAVDLHEREWDHI